MAGYDSYSDFLQSNVRGIATTDTINSAFEKCWCYTHNHDNIAVAISGGADSDIMLDMIERTGYSDKCQYIFYNTGIEFAATKRHLKYLEEKYGIKINSVNAAIPVPLGCKKYGLPFLSKRVSDYIHRLQINRFQWEDGTFDELYLKYPHCKTALKWWCNANGDGSQMNISRNKWLKEFIMQNPPCFPISDACCIGAKKKTAKIYINNHDFDLYCLGLRKLEGGVRTTAYSSCFSDSFSGPDQFRPIFWFQQNDKRVYEESFGVVHSDCYTEYGLKRTGCACCPFGRNWQTELNVAAKYEPNLYRVATTVFGLSYEYTRRYEEFKLSMDQKV